MAKLKAGKFGVEITVSVARFGFVDYQFAFSCRGKPLFVPAKYRKAFDYDLSEKLVLLFEQAARVRQEYPKCYWFAAYDKVYILATLFYAEGWKGYLDGPDEPALADIPKEKERQLKELDLLRKKNGDMLPGDLIELSFLMFEDKLLFSGDELVSGTGPGVRFLVRRDAIKSFAGQLEKEFKRELKKRGYAPGTARTGVGDPV